ncbi:ABC-three component system protein [Sulfurimonas sp. NWX367]|uniref:ABC-three component system protein n=1 Tax=Sulfurimonas sp. NWX367 TaxID=2925413 RepID=UPI003204E251
MNEVITAQQILQGAYVSPTDRLKLISADDWEIFTEEWLDLKTSTYIKTERLAGAGDMGRDIVAYITDPRNNPQNYQWDCYQCKHYDHPLRPSDIWMEFGKIIYYTFKSKYPIPAKYYFIAPQGIGTSLNKLLQDPSNLKDELKKNWDKYCKTKITDTEEVLLGDELLNYFESFNFSIFDGIVPKVIISEYKNHEKYLVRFGGSLPPRPIVDIPSKIEDLRYIDQLVKSYNTNSTDEILNVGDISSASHQGHFEDARKSFYKAEELRMLNRDSLPDGIFENLKENIYDGVSSKSREEFDDGYKKVLAIESEAGKIPIESNPLKDACQTIDKKGLCHHLVNDEKLTWVEDE